MTTTNKIALLALIISVMNPFINKLLERWSIKPRPTPDQNKLTGQIHPFNRFSRFLMSDTFDLVLSLMPLAIAVVLATAPLMSGFIVFAIALGVSSFSIQFMLKPGLNRLRKDVDDLIRIVNARS